jgi:hypothetical protein
MFAGPVLILLAEGPAILRWLARRRLDPILHPELRPPIAASAPTRSINTDGLLDRTPTEPLRLEAVRAALKANRPPPREEPPMTETVLVGAGGMTVTRVRPSIREHRS